VACPSPACPGPALLPACGAGPATLSGDFVRLALVTGHDVDLIDLYLATQHHFRCPGHQAIAELLRHGLHVRGAQAQFCCDLPVREVQAHEVQAQHPHPQGLMVSGQHRAGEIIKAPRARLASKALPVRLRVIVAIADDHAAFAATALT